MERSDGPTYTPSKPSTLRMSSSASRAAAGLDHRNRLGHRIGRLKVGGSVQAAERQRGARPPGALAERREFDELDQASRILAAVDHRRQDSAGAGVQSWLAKANAPIGTRAMVGLPASATRRIERHGAIEVDRAVLHVEHNRVESFARQPSATAGSFMVTQAHKAWPLPARRSESLLSTDSFIPVPVR